MELLKVEDLKKVLNDKLKKVENKNNGEQILLEEKRQDQPNMRVTVTGLRESTLAIRLKGHCGSYLKPNKELRLTKNCDYLLIYQSRSKYYAVLIELKSSLSDKEKGKEQLRRSLPIWDYLFSVCKIACGSNRSNPLIKYVLIAERTSKTLDKQSVKVKTGSNNYTENYRNIKIRMLIGTNFAIETLIR